jgi:hypothetical protein
LPDLKKEVILNFLRFNIQSLIKEKRTQLISRAKQVSLISTLVGTLPIPGLSLNVDCKLILSELDVYRHTLFITESNLKILADKTGMDVNELKSIYNFKSFFLFNDRSLGATQFLVPMLTKVAEEAHLTAKVLPVIGSAFGVATTYYITYKFLTSTLETLVQDAEKMLDILLEKPGSSICQSN